MSLGDYLLPWKAIPNMIRDVKKAGGKGKDGKDNHGSVVGAVGKYADPAGALFGDRWMEFFHERLPTKMNEYASGVAKKDPMIRFDRKYGLAQEGSPLRPVSDWAQDRPADTTALVLGSIFGGGALLGGAGAGGGGGAGAGAGAAAGAGGGTGGGAAAGGGAGGSGWGSLNFANMNWQDPNTYMQLAQLMPQQKQQPPPQQPPPRRPPPQPVLTTPPPSTTISPQLYAVLAQIARTRRV